MDGIDRNAILVAGFGLVGVFVTAASAVLIAVITRSGRRSQDAAYEARDAAIQARLDSATAVIAAALQAARAETKLDGIHVLVNSRLTQALAAIAALKRRLKLEPTREELLAELEVEKLHGPPSEPLP